jgi:hypothetical protein
VRPFEESLHVYPASTLQFMHPIFIPLSHFSLPALMESPHVIVQFDISFSAPVQVYPRSSLHAIEHPGAFPLSQISEITLLLSPHIGEHFEMALVGPTQVYPIYQKLNNSSNLFSSHYHRLR